MIERCALCHAYASTERLRATADGRFVCMDFDGCRDRAILSAELRELVAPRHVPFVGWVGRRS